MDELSARVEVGSLLSSPELAGSGWPEGSFKALRRQGPRGPLLEECFLPLRWECFAGMLE